jgi:hypothetical protein
MRKFLVVTTFLTGMLMPVAASGQDDLLTTLFAKMGEVYTEKGYEPTGWEHRGTLKPGEDEMLPVTLAGGSEYHIVGACDADCSDFDIELLDANGKQVDVDDKEDDFPIVVSDASGSFTAHLLMSKCASASCAYGVKIFRK